MQMILFQQRNECHSAENHYIKVHKFVNTLLKFYRLHKSSEVETVFRIACKNIDNDLQKIKIFFGLHKLYNMYNEVELDVLMIQSV